MTQEQGAGNAAAVSVIATAGKLVAVLTAKDFAADAQTNIGTLSGDAMGLARLSVPPAKNQKNPPPAAPTNLKALSDGVKKIVADELAEKVDLEAGKCLTLGGCFAAGMKMWTPDGFRNVEDILEGEYVFARDEFDPNGAIIAKCVEKKFERIGRILHLHVTDERGRVSAPCLIRTTPEHPFFQQDKGWTQASALEADDTVRTDNGWVKVEELFDTGEYETVYNLRVAEHHTYFVGDEEWGFAVWAHNICLAIARGDLNWTANKPILGHAVWGAAQNTTGTTGDRHADWVMKIVTKLAAIAPINTYFVLNRSWRTALGEAVVDKGTAGANKRPDIIIAEPLGDGKSWKIHAIEVKSGTQDDIEMFGRMDEAWATVKPHSGAVRKGQFKSIAIGQEVNIAWAN